MTSDGPEVPVVSQSYMRHLRRKQEQSGLAVGRDLLATFGSDHARSDVPASLQGRERRHAVEVKQAFGVGQGRAR